MIVYIIGTALSMLLAYTSMHAAKPRATGIFSRRFFVKLFAFLSFLPLTFIMAVRYNVGTDYQNYRTIFLYDRLTSDPGFNWLYHSIYFFSRHPQAFFIVTSVIICAAYYAAIYRESLFRYIVFFCLSS